MVHLFLLVIGVLVALAGVYYLGVDIHSIVTGQTKKDLPMQLQLDAVLICAGLSVVWKQKKAMKI